MRGALDARAKKPITSDPTSCVNREPLELRRNPNRNASHVKQTRVRALILDYGGVLGAPF